MQLFVVRHAIAEDVAPDQPDAERALTTRGARKFREAVHGLRAIGWQVDRVVSSPWQRAAQTAKLLAPVCKGPLIESELLCDAPGPALLALIADHSRVAVVGHEPWLGQLVALMAFGDPKLGEGLELKKGSVAWLEGSPIAGGMTLRALVPPKLLRALA